MRQASRGRREACQRTRSPLRDGFHRPNRRGTDHACLCQRPLNLSGSQDPSLQRCFSPPADVESDFDLWLVTTERLRHEPRIRALVDFLAGYFANAKYREIHPSQGSLPVLRFTVRCNGSGAKRFTPRGCADRSGGGRRPRRPRPRADPGRERARAHRPHPRPGRRAGSDPCRTRPRKWSRLP